LKQKAGNVTKHTVGCA